MNFQMFKLVLEKAEEPEIKLPTSIGSSEEQESSWKKHLLLLYWLRQSLWLWLWLCLWLSLWPYMDHNDLWKILKEMGLPDNLTCLLRNLYAGQKATVRTGNGKTDWLQIKNGIRQGWLLSPCLFNWYAEYIMQNARLDETQAGIKIVGEISITLDMQMTSPLWQKVKN